MPNLEAHTLNKLETDMSAELLARAARLAASIKYDAPEKAPEDTGAFSFGEPKVYSVLGDRLPDIQSQFEKKESLARNNKALGSLASRASISMSTGCWSVIDAWRNDSGYAFIWDPDEYGYHVKTDDKFGGVLLHRMAYNLKLRHKGLPDLTKEEQLDHVCRWPGCCNTEHLKIVDHKTNNELRDLARKMEIMLAAGQILLGPVGIGWLDEMLENCREEDTNIIITTHLGPYRLHKLDNDPLLFVAKPEVSGLLEVVKPPAPKRYVKPSQSKKLKVHKSQKKIFPEKVFEDMKKPRVSVHKKYERWQKTGSF